MSTLGVLGKGVLGNQVLGQGGAAEITISIQSTAYTLPSGQYFAQALVNPVNNLISRNCQLIVSVNGTNYYSDIAAEPNAEPIAVFTCPEGQMSQVTITLDIFAVNANEQHTVQNMGIFSWVSQAQQQAITAGQAGLGRGGFMGVTSLYILRSDGLAVRGASYANPLPIPTTSQSVTIYDYECVPTVTYTYTSYTIYNPNPNVYIMSLPDTSNLVTFNTTQWWEIDPTNPPSAVAAQPTQWQPVNTEQSQAHIVAGQPTMNMVANAVMHQDFQATFETFHTDTYQALDTLTKSQRIIFVSSPWGVLDSGYFRFGPQTGGMSSGVGNQTKNTTLLPSTASQPHRTIQVTAVAQQRPGV
jgi:hypothetical protein